MGDGQVPVKMEPTDFTPIFIAVLAILITLVIFAIYRRRKGARNGILLTGLCDSGKTLLFSQLIHKSHAQTYTSIKENIGSYVVNNSNLKIIDIPGHERLRDKFIEQYKVLTRGIVFVVDSLTVQQDVRDAAEFLYNILADPVIVSNNTQVLILCNKQDLTLSKGSNAVKSMLEKELNTLRITKSSQLDSVDPKAKRIASLGHEDKDFSFVNLPIKVEFGEAFAFSKSGGLKIDELEQWLASTV